MVVIYIYYIINVCNVLEFCWGYGNFLICCFVFCNFGLIFIMYLGVLKMNLCLYVNDFFKEDMWRSI